MKVYFEDQAPYFSRCNETFCATSLVIVSSNSVIYNGTRIPINSISSVNFSGNLPLDTLSSLVPFSNYLFPQYEMLIVKCGNFRKHELGRTNGASCLSSCLYGLGFRYNARGLYKQLRENLEIRKYLSCSWPSTLENISSEIEELRKTHPEIIEFMDDYHRLDKIRNAIIQAIANI